MDIKQSLERVPARSALRKLRKTENEEEGLPFQHQPQCSPRHHLRKKAGMKWKSKPKQVQAATDPLPRVLRANREAV
ncbi:hypothetical protein MATL_G00130210 [Megalops atlanticus]|uniref:Uncharacterized protein n=1 Tax=Megalops atlanticus TaxID=7932 RepID=A0A9D3PWB9_MEGAT|nr:hypothetical protein MATL_G00130210 [Megalops atlanticus]